MGWRPEAIVSDLMEALGEDVLKEAAHKFVGIEGHGMATVGRGVLIDEADACIGDAEYSGVGNGNAMDVASEVGQDDLGALDGWFTEDVPAFLPDTSRDLDLREMLL